MDDSEDLRQEAKQKLFKAKKHVSTALHNIQTALCPSTWGHLDHADGFNEMLKEYLTELELIKLQLEKIAHKIC